MLFKQLFYSIQYVSPGITIKRKAGTFPKNIPTNEKKRANVLSKDDKLSRHLRHGLSYFPTFISLPAPPDMY